MPLYEYRCPEGHDFEKFYRSINAAPTEERCPACGEVANRLMSTAGLVFKGSGFYITDYGKDGKKAEREAISAEKTKTEASDAAKKAEVKTPEGASPAPESPATEKSKPAAAAASAAAPTATPAEKQKAAPKGKTGE
ncbi:MAG TPA: FmdB family zinc ribbon protein [Gemmatimonadaceae bacterium]|nr:FmdB family zinc ribbon protein [Gemmatimonadaceae bacterium]